MKNSISNAKPGILSKGTSSFHGGILENINTMLLSWLVKVMTMAPLEALKVTRKRTHDNILVFTSIILNVQEN